MNYTYLFSTKVPLHTLKMKGKIPEIRGYQDRKLQRTISHQLLELDGCEAP